MRKFDFYEFTGIIVPGTILLVGAAICSETVKQHVFAEDVSIGEATLSLIVAYGLGHLVQALGNLIESAWWWAWGGKPTDWPRSGRHQLLSDEQTDSIDTALANKLRFNMAGGFKSLSSADWYSVARPRLQ